MRQRLARASRGEGHASNSCSGRNRRIGSRRLCCNERRWNVRLKVSPRSRGSKEPATIPSSRRIWTNGTARKPRESRYGSMPSSPPLENFVVLAGDVHHNRASELKRDFGDAASASIGVEFVATSISSGGDGKSRPANASKLAGRQSTSSILQCSTRLCSPHRRCRAVAGRLHGSRPGSALHEPVKKAAGFVVESGRPRLSKS